MIVDDEGMSVSTQKLDQKIVWGLLETYSLRNIYDIQYTFTPYPLPPLTSDCYAICSFQLLKPNDFLLLLFLGFTLMLFIGSTTMHTYRRL